MDAPLISVIVPVYKVEAYLDRCVQSIVDQTYRNLEIILVDDGSPDNCGAMCDAWAEKDSRIKVIHKENGGGARARNIGLEYASGQYIGFVDSDDFIAPEMYQYLYQLHRKTQCDIAECGYSIVYGHDFPEDDATDTYTVLNTEAALKENIRDCICRQLVWNKLYRRETIGAIRMVEGKTIDDEFFTYRVLAQAKTVAVGSRKMYAYRQQDNSVMHQKYSLKWLGAVEARLERYLFLQDRFPALEADAGTNLLFTCMYHGQLALKHLVGSERSQVLAQLKDTVCRVHSSSGHLSASHKFWIFLAKRSIVLCCKFRNLLRIGL